MKPDISPGLRLRCKLLTQEKPDRNPDYIKREYLAERVFSTKNHAHEIGAMIFLSRTFNN